MPSSLRFLRLHGEALQTLALHQTAVRALGCAEADLTRRSVQLVETLERTALTIRNPIGREVTEQHGLCAAGHFRHIGRGHQTIAEQLVRLTFLQTGLPEILTVAVLQPAEVLDRAVVQQKDRLFAIAGLHRMNQVDDLVRRDRRTDCSYAGGRAVYTVKQTGGLRRIVAVNIAALAEGMMLARRAGTDPEKVFEAIRGGLAGSTVMNAKAPMMLANDFPPGFRIDLHIKDLNNALETGEKFDSPLPLTEMVQSAFRELSGNGDGSLDHSALLKYYSARTGVKLKEEE